MSRTWLTINIIGWCAILTGVIFDSCPIKVALCTLIAEHMIARICTYWQNLRLHQFHIFSMFLANEIVELKKGQKHD